MQPVRLCILSNKQIWMMLVVVKVVRSARCSPLLIKWPPPISHYLVCCRFTMTWSVSDSQLSWVTIMGLFSLSPPPNYFQMLGCNLQREWKDLCMVCMCVYVCICIWTGTISPRVQRQKLWILTWWRQSRGCWSLCWIPFTVDHFFKIDREKTLLTSKHNSLLESKRS